MKSPLRSFSVFFLLFSCSWRCNFLIFFPFYYLYVCFRILVSVFPVNRFLLVIFNIIFETCRNFPIFSPLNSPLQDIVENCKEKQNFPQTLINMGFMQTKKASCKAMQNALVHLTRFEPVTFGSVDRCSIQLS